MSNIAKLKKKAADLEQKKQFDKALAVYVQILDQLDPREDEADVALYNRVGDLLLRQGNVPEALNHYEKAVDLYAEGGFFNNAIALCNKILRNAPGRSSIYYKLGKISAKKGFVSDAKQNFLEYADRMQKVGSIDEAFRALKEFADLCPDQDDIRLMLAEQLSKRERKDEALEQLQILYEKLDAEGRGAEARATIDRMKSIDPQAEPKATGKRRKEKGGELVFLDVDYDDPPARKAPARPPRRSLTNETPPEGVDEIGNAAAPPADASRGGAVEPMPFIQGEPFANLQGEPDLPISDVTHGADFDASLDDDVGSDAGGISGFEGTSLGHHSGENGARSDEGLIDLEDASFGIVHGSASVDPSGFGGLDMDRADIDLGAALSFERPEHDLVLPGELPSLDGPTTGLGGSGLGLAPDPFSPDFDTSPLDDLDPPLTRQDSGAGRSPLDEDLPLIMIEGADGLDTSDRETAPALDESSFLGGDDAFAIGAASADAPASSRSRGRSADDPVEQLRQRVAEDEANPVLRRELAEALIERGEREEGARELETAMISFERAGNLDAAESVADEIIRLNPNSVRHHQKRVEYAFRTNDKPRLGEAYLELADALFRTGQGDKARAVYQRVLELTPDDVRAQAALSAFADPQQEAPPPKKPGKEKKEQSGVFRRYTADPSKAEKSTADTGRSSAELDDSFINLGDVLRDEARPRSTRMVVEERAPSGNEQADFSEMLRKFKQGVAQNVDDEDHESHYDLGVAFKEMGLLDEAIAEFQKALRGAQLRVRTYEALGQCFLEQSQFAVASTVLARALKDADHSDEQLIGVLYLLGYASEATQRYDVALSCYQRVYAVDIGFRDVGARITALQRVAT